MVWARILLGAGFGVCVATSPAHAEVRIGAAGPLTGHIHGSASSTNGVLRWPWRS